MRHYIGAVWNKMSKLGNKRIGKKFLGKYKVKMNGLVGYDATYCNIG